MDTDTCAAMAPAGGWDAGLPSDETLTEAAYLVSRGVRPMALIDHCLPDEMTVLRAMTRLQNAAQYLGDSVIPFVVPDPRPPQNASCGYASHPWVIELYRWACGREVSQPRRHQIIGLLLGYSPAAIARHGEVSAGETAGVSGG